MKQPVIASRDNALAKHARAVRDGRVGDRIFIEGVRLCEEALSASLHIEEVLYTESLAGDERGARLLRSLKRVSGRASAVSEQVLASVSDTKSPQGIVALASRPRTDAHALEGTRDNRSPLLLIMHRTNNPANAGALLRAAEAAGASGAITTAGATDILSPKALRGAMGSSFRLPLWTGPEYAQALDWCAARGISTVCADARATRFFTEIDWTGGRALIVGPEASGLSPDEVAAADEAVRIPLRSPVESLNLAVAGAIILYEAARQRVLAGEIRWSNNS